MHTAVATIILDITESSLLLKTSYLNLETNEHASRYYFKENSHIWYSSSIQKNDTASALAYQELEQKYIQQKNFRALSSRNFSFLKSVNDGESKIFFSTKNTDEWYFFPFNK